MFHLTAPQLDQLTNLEEVDNWQIYFVNIFECSNTLTVLFLLKTRILHAVAYARVMIKITYETTDYLEIILHSDNSGNKESWEECYRLCKIFMTRNVIKIYTIDKDVNIDFVQQRVFLKLWLEKNKKQNSVCRYFLMIHTIIVWHFINIGSAV